MPELPEAEITKRKLEPIVNKVVSLFWTDREKNLMVSSYNHVRRDMKGMKVTGLRRHGKVILIDMAKGDEERLMAFHQRMSGSLLYSDTPFDETHVHTRIEFDDKGELRFRDPRKFGVVWYGRPEDVMAHPSLAKLGPDARGMDRDVFISRVARHKGIIKPILLRQDVVAGLGNIIVDEALWKSCIHPERSVRDITEKELGSLHTSLVNVIEDIIKANGSSLRDWGHPDGERGESQNSFSVYGRMNEPCLDCGNPILRVVVGQRGTWVCNKCQRP